MKEKEFNNIVVLIDAENISPRYAKNIFENIAIFGTISVRRIYGDWSSSLLGKWISLLQEYSLVPVQQFNNIGAKNVSDFTIVIDAMDLVHEDMFDCFCFVSSDSDFTRLAQRIREKGKYVIGIGESKTPKAFVNACDKFTYLNETQSKKRPERKKSRPSPTPAFAVADIKTPAQTNLNDFEVSENDFAEYDASEENKDLIELALENLQEDDGWVMISKIIPYIQRIKSDFKIEDIRLNGRRLYKFSDYFTPKDFDINKPNGESTPGPIYVRKK